MRLLYGLDRLPSTLAPDDPRLPGVDLGPEPLRLNFFPLPPAAWGSGGVGHAARMDAMRDWLLASCGDYNGALRRGVTQYLAVVAAHVEAHRDELSACLARFHGLYDAQDWCWSALRPLPRAWWREDGTWVRADLAFWDGRTVIAVEARSFDDGALAAGMQQFWIGQILPVSPFRREFPDGVSLRPTDSPTDQSHRSVAVLTGLDPDISRGTE